MTLQVRLGAHAGFYPTYIADEEPNAIVIAVPIAKGRYVPLVPGSPVRLDYNEPSGGIYRLFTTVTGRKPGIVVLAAEGRCDYEQRRQDVRLSVSCPLRFGVVKPMNVYADTDLPIFNGRTRDISGGGLQLITTLRMAAGTLIDLEIDLPDGVCYIAGEVVRYVATIEHVEQPEHILGVRFTSQGRSRERIVAFIFEQQRLLLKNGLLGT